MSLLSAVVRQLGLPQELTETGLLRRWSTQASRIHSYHPSPVEEGNMTRRFVENHILAELSVKKNTKP